MGTENLVRGLLIVLATAVLIYLFLEYSRKQKQKDEGFEELNSANDSYETMFSESNKQAPSTITSSSDKAVPYVRENAASMLKESSPHLRSSECFPKDRLTAEDLLPKDAANSKWAQVNPAGQGDLKDQNFLTAGYHMGINTVGNSLRNPNLQIRSEFPNPQIKVSPWNQTTIESDLNRRPLEIGGCE
jgi:hypothetical protein